MTSKMFNAIACHVTGEGFNPTITIESAPIGSTLDGYDTLTSSNSIRWDQDDNGHDISIIGSVHETAFNDGSEIFEIDISATMYVDSKDDESFKVSMNDLTQLEVSRDAAMQKLWDIICDADRSAALKGIQRRNDAEPFVIFNSYLKNRHGIQSTRRYEMYINNTEVK